MKKHSLIGLLLTLSLIITIWQPVIGTVSAAELNAVPSVGLSINGETTTWNITGTQPEKLWDDSTSTFLEYFDPNGLNFTLTKQLTDVPSGKYNLSVLLHGDKDKTLDGQSVMSATTSEGTFTEAINFTGSDWGKPVPLTINNIMVGTDGLVTISFKIVMNEKFYGYLQDVQFTQGASVTKTTIKPNSAELRPNASVQLATVHNGDESVVYSSSDEAVAIVSATGLVMAIGDGSATITAEVLKSGALLRTGTSAIYVSSTLQNYTGTEISVEPIAELEGSHRSDFMMGADISSLYALEQAGRKYYDLAGQDTSMIQALKDGGVNWIRLRTWVDPTDGNGHSYGAGEVNEAVMIEMAKDAKAADLNVLVDLHYSDFWADPGRQNTPKAWANLSEADLEQKVYDYTYETLTALYNNDNGDGVYPDMIQIGNEINGGLLWPLGNSAAKAEKYISQGIKAVRDFEVNVGGNKHIDIVIHRANPNDGLTKVREFYETYSDLDYDVIGLSYYPFWHGSLANIQEVMNGLAATFNKKVAIVETSYGYTLEDPINNGDTGHVFGQTQADTAGYLATVQGQASAIRDVINVVAQVPDAQGVGVFYWEPGWLLGTDTGWATTHAASYQGEKIPTDGGASWANQAMFNYFGEALPSIEVFKLVREQLDLYEQPTLLSVDDIAITTSQGVYVELPTTVKALYTDDTYREVAVQAWTPNEYNVMIAGNIQLIGTLSTGKEIKANITITPFNYIVNPGVEADDLSVWQLIGADRGESDPYLGKYAIHFWDQELVHVKQQITNLPDGIYELSVQAQIGSDHSPIAATSNLYAKNEVETFTEPLVVTGWGNWRKIIVKDIIVEDGALEIGAIINDAMGDFGDFDDWQLIRTGELTTTTPPPPGPGSTSAPTATPAPTPPIVQLSLQTVGNDKVWQGTVNANATSATIDLPTTNTANQVVIQWGEDELQFSLADLIEAGNNSASGLYIQWQVAAALHTGAQLVGLQGAQVVPIGKPFHITVQATTNTGTVIPQFINLPMTLTFALDADIDFASVALYQLNDKGELIYVGGITSDGSIQAVINDGATYVLANVSRPYTDVTNPNEQLRKLTSMGVIQGDQQGRANLEQQVTRAEISKMITKLFGLDSELLARQLNQPLSSVASDSQSLTFTDVPVNHWASPYIDLLTEREWLVGTGQDKFSPNKEMSYEEIYTLLSRILQLPLSEQSTVSAYEASNWAEPHIESLIQAGIISAEQAAKIDFKEKVTRGSAISIAYDLLQTLEKLNK